MMSATTSSVDLVSQFKARVPTRVDCPECEASFFRAALEKELEKSIERYDLEKHVEHPSEVTFLECPQCGKGVDFSR